MGETKLSEALHSLSLLMSSGSLSKEKPFFSTNAATQADTQKSPEF